MKADPAHSTEIPCFRCLLWNEHDDCNPNECRELTEWLFTQVKKYQHTVERLRQTVEALNVYER